MPLTRKVAFIDLSRKEYKVLYIPKELRKKFLGGRGLNIYFLYKLTNENLDPFSPDNPLIFGTGLLSGIFYGRMNISGKSPESGYLGDSNMGGFFGAELASTPYSHLIILGKSKKPTYIFVNNDKIEFLEATHLWGKETWETQSLIKQELGDESIRVACIGPAGENLVRFSCIITGLKNAAGRTGLGALMGSKFLKAVAVRGATPLKLAHPKEFLNSMRKINEKAYKTNWGKALGKLGTPLLLKNANEKGFTSYKYHQFTYVDDPKIKNFYAESLNKKYAKQMVSCFGCPIHCRHRYEVKDEKGKMLKGEGPEYATIASWGPTLGNLDLSSVIKLNELCNRLGIDTISGGNYFGYFFKLFQDGIISKKDVGYSLKWGDHDAIEKLLYDTAYRRGFGNIVAEGSFSYKLLPQSEKAKKELLHIKNVSIEMTDERSVVAFALGLGVATRGTCHMRSRASIDVVPYPRELLKEFYGGDVGNDWLDYKGKARIVWWHEIFNAVVDSIGLCRFASIFSSINSIGYIDISEMLNITMDLIFSEKDLTTIGERIYTLERMFLNREGIKRKDDYLPELYYEQPIPTGPTKGKKIVKEKYEELLNEYYKLHGWTEEGIVPLKRIKELGLYDLFNKNS